MSKIAFLLAMLMFSISLQGCASDDGSLVLPQEDEASNQTSPYVIGPGDVLQVYVWDNPDLSVTIPVRPDGLVTIPLVEDMRAIRKTPSQLARDIERELTEYLRTPKVNIIVTNFRGTYRQQIRVVGQAVNPRSLSFQSGMTLLDVMIEVGGLSEFASGNRAKVIRWKDGVQNTIRVRLKDLINDGDISANIQMAPGDILIIPESIF